MDKNRKGEPMGTYSGTLFYPLEPCPRDVVLDDIIQALPNICRYNGHVKFHYSVAQHCLLCAEEARLRGLGIRLQLLCLLHDAAEAYSSDVIRPWKKMFPEIEVAENNIQKIILKSLGIKYPSEAEQRIVQNIDDTLLATEMKILLPLLKFDGEQEPSRHVTIMEFPIPAIRATFKKRLLGYLQPSKIGGCIVAP